MRRALVALPQTGWHLDSADSDAEGTLHTDYIAHKAALWARGLPGEAWLHDHAPREEGLGGRGATLQGHAPCGRQGGLLASGWTGASSSEGPLSLCSSHV